MIAAVLRCVAPATALLLVSGACSDGEEGADLPICNGQTGRVTVDDAGEVETVDFTNDELAAIGNACEASANLEEERIASIGSAFVAGDFAALCGLLTSAADQAETNLPAAVADGGAADVVEFIVGEAIRFDEVDALAAECGDEIARYGRAVG